MVPGQGGEPEREAGEVDRHRVAVDAVEAALGDKAAGVQLLVLVGRQGRASVGVDAPGLDEPRAELAAGLDEEGAGAHGRVADFEREDGVGRGGGTDAGESGLERMADDR